MPIRTGFLILTAALTAAPPPGACPGGAALAGFELSAHAPGESEPSPLRSITRLNGGARVVYAPRELYNANGQAQVSLISIPTTPEGVLGVLEAHDASERAEWVVPSRAAAVALVYGPQGLDLAKLAELMRRDAQLIAQLAMYAEKSAQTEMLMETVAAWERSGSSQSLEAALSGFASRQGVAFPVLNRSASPDQQALTLMRALHPALSGLDPLAPSTGTRMHQSAGLAASVAGLFLGNPVGLASAGGALFLNLRTLFFPGSEFRSALSQQVGEASYLCAKREPAKSRTRLVYLWAWRIQSAPPPRLEGLPYRLNLGQAGTRVTLRGHNLEGIRGVSATPAETEFLETESAVRVKLPPTARKGDKFDLRLEVEDSPVPVVAPGAIEVLGPRPALQAAQPSLPQELSVPLSNGEIPANAFTALSIRSVGAGPLPLLHLECNDSSLTLKKLSIRPGEQAGNARLRMPGPERMFLSFEPGAVGQPPCELEVRMETGDGISDPLRIGRLVRVPRIEKFSLTPEMIAADAYAGWIEGEELESIERTGWNAEKGLPVNEPPLPVASSGSRQRLRIAMPWPPPAPRANLFVWLRGESAGRRTPAVY